MQNTPLEVPAPGALGYDTGFIGSDSFTYSAGDGTSVSAPATVAITVTTATCDSVPPGAIVGTAGNNTLAGTAGDDLIYGLGGHDVIDGAGWERPGRRRYGHQHRRRRPGP